MQSAVCGFMKMLYGGSMLVYGVVAELDMGPFG